MMAEDNPSPSPPPNAPVPTATDGTATTTFRRLQTGPQTAIDMTALSATEREQVRVIGADATGSGRATVTGSFIPVYYRPQDEADAVDLFATLNTKQLTELTLGRQNVLKRSLPTDLYIRVLDAVGRVRVKRYEYVVRESRENGNWWLIDPKWYDERPDARYDPGEHVACVPPSASLRRLFDTSGAVVAETDLQATPIEGNLGMVLRYYYSADDYDCHPDKTADGEIILRKI